MGIYKFLFANGNREEIGAYCEKKLRKLEEYDSANSTDLIDTFLAYYMNGFSYVQGISKRIEVQGLNNRMGTVQSVSINRFLG